MKRHKYQWLLSGLLILVAFSLGAAIYNTQRPETTTTQVSHATIKTHYADWTRLYLRGNQQQKYVKTNNTTNAQTLSESQGYGMLITVMAAQQGIKSHATFDQLTRYYLAHRISGTNPLMAWRQQLTNGKMVSTAAERTSATDGDLDIAYALILADERWHSNGTLNYGQLAKRLLRAIKRREINQTTSLPKVGDWATTSNRNVVRPSDLMTAYFRKFASYTQDGSWTKVAQNSQTTLQKLSRQQTTGLMADFVTVNGVGLTVGAVKANQVSSVHDNQYGYNACRIPWRVAYDYELNHSQISKSIVQKMLRFFTKQSKLTAVYTLKGQAVENYANLAFTAPVYYAAEVLNNTTLLTRYKSTVTATMNQRDYYPATIQMVTLLASGAMR